MPKWKKVEGNEHIGIVISGVQIYNEKYLKNDVCAEENKMICAEDKCKKNSDSKLISQNTGKWEIPKPTDEQRAIWLEAMKQIVDENGRVTLDGVSDGSFLGEFECFYILDAIGCTDIKLQGRPATANEIPKDRPFLTWHYQVSGNLPKENKQI